MIPKNAIGLAILCSLAALSPALALALAAEGAARPAAIQKAPDKTRQPPGSEVPTFEVRGTVVDEAGTPVPRAKVVTATNGDVDVATVADAAGNFRLDLPEWQTLATLLAKDDAGLRVGSLPYASGKTRPAARIVVHAARSIAVHVVDGKGRAIAGAKVGVTFASGKGSVIDDPTRQRFLRQQTDAQGHAVLRFPADWQLAHVWAFKAGAGFDYVLYRSPYDRALTTKEFLADPARRDPDDCGPLEFVLGGVHTLRVHVLSERRQPLPGLRIRMSHIERPDRGGGAGFVEIDEFQATTDATGTAEFDSIPVEALPDVSFRNNTVGYEVSESATLDPAKPLTEVHVVAKALPVLRVEVTYADGRPALGAEISSFGRQYNGPHRGPTGGRSLCEGAGEVALRAFDGDSYFVVSAIREGFASKMEAHVARMGQPLRSVHLVLMPATRVRGTLTVGKDHRPGAHESVHLVERDQDNYSRLPEDEQLPQTISAADRGHIAMLIPRYTITDEQGHFEFDAAPGAYFLGTGRVRISHVATGEDVKAVFPDGVREVEIRDQKEIEINLHREDQVPAKSRSAKTKRPRNRLVRRSQKFNSIRSVGSPSS